MPIIVEKKLPVLEILKNENYNVLNCYECKSKNKPHKKIAILNLMPIKEETELQLLRKLGLNDNMLSVTFLYIESYISQNISREYLETYYKCISDVIKEKFDGLIVTGAPVETMEYEDVSYWGELCNILDWAKLNVKSVLYICWGAQAGLYYNYKIQKYKLDAKAFGIFSHQKNVQSDILYGVTDEFVCPHSRYTEILKEDILKCKNIRVVSESKDVGVGIVESLDKKEVYIIGHFEYSIETLDKEYKRDLEKGLKIDAPKNYYKNVEDKSLIEFNWKQSGDAIFNNWVNYYL